MPKSSTSRCAWAGSDPLNVAYHDREWGVPEHREERLFEMLTLEGAQAGLSWLTILRKRGGYRDAFAGFDPRRVAGFDDRRVAELVQNPAIVRHRGKIEAKNKGMCMCMLLLTRGRARSLPHRPAARRAG